jgi:hypothetical protein
MSTMTREELAVRLAELKRQDWPRFRLSHIVPDSPGVAGRALLDAAEDPDHAALIDAYLRAFVPGDCPGCGWGRFGWGIQHGSGSCACGWPGTLYHSIVDRRDLPHHICHSIINGIRVCECRRDEHILRPSRWNPDEEEVGCPNPVVPPGLGLYRPFTSEWRPPVVVRVETLLWVHPYEVHLTGPKDDDDGS